jgi:hypothetical protein
MLISYQLAAFGIATRDIKLMVTNRSGQPHDLPPGPQSGYSFPTRALTDVTTCGPVTCPELASTGAVTTPPKTAATNKNNTVARRTARAYRRRYRLRMAVARRERGTLATLALAPFAGA